MRNAESLASTTPTAAAHAPLITAFTRSSTGARRRQGIATINDRELSYHKDLGLVGDVFDDETLERLNGTMAVGHVRYATTGGGRRENAQPLTLKYVKGTLAVAHNGNLVNTPGAAHRV